MRWQGKHCVRFLRHYWTGPRTRTVGAGAGGGGELELRLEFAARAVGRAVWRVRPVHNNNNNNNRLVEDYVTISLEVRTTCARAPWPA
jgi:hypothetical protein